MEAKVATLTAIYNYKERLDIWRNYATVNKVIIGCEKCSKTRCHKSILLDNGKHICWFCWIRRDSSFGKVVVKPQPKVENKPTKIQTKVTPLESKKESEIEILEEALSTVDDIIDEPAYETELIKLANGVLVNHVEPSPMLNKQPAPIILETKTMDTNNNTTPATEVKKDQEVATSEVKVETKSTEKTTATVGKEQYQEMPEVVYSKLNPYMAQLGIQESKWKKVTWNVVKYGLALLLTIFAIISLYFTSMWQSVNSNGFLVNLKIISVKIIEGAEGTKVSFYAFNLPDLSKIPGISPDYQAFLSFAGSEGVAQMLSSLTLYNLNPAFSEGALNSLIAFAIISIVAIFPLLVFKNGTVCSVAFIGTGLVLLIIIITLYSIGMSAQNIFVTTFRDINNAASSYSAQPSDVLVTRINDSLRALLDALKLPA